MLKEIPAKEFTELFPCGTNPFLDHRFIALNRHKADEVKYLIRPAAKPSIGFVGGTKGDSLVSHFSAPFGGFHFHNENTYISECEAFSESLKSFLDRSAFNHFSIVFPPSLYRTSFNSKMISSLLRNGFTFSIPDLTNIVALQGVGKKYRQKNSREYYGQATRNELKFRQISDETEKMECYRIVAENRTRFGRPLYLTIDDLRKIERLWPVDYFGVFSKENVMTASAIFYRFDRGIAFAVYWGDSEMGRSLRAMDYMLLNLWQFYKEESFSFVDLGISTEAGGLPNEGLLRFKETHEADTELRHRIEWHRKE